MWSGVIDFLTEMAGFGGSAGALALAARDPRQGRMHLPDQGR